MAAAALTVAVPAQALLNLAERFRNEDFLATYSREVKADAATNHTVTQIMKIVSGLNKTLKGVVGMTTVGEEIANCIAPFIRKASTPTDDEDMVALFQFTPDDIKVLQASDDKVMSEISDSAEQTRNKFNKKNNITNYEAIFYMMIVLVRYRPKKQTFDYYHAYMLCQDTSIWQWAMSSAEKQKRMAALQLECANLLGMELARHSNQMVEVVPEIKPFEDLQKDLQKDLEVVPALTVAVPAQTLLDLAGRFTNEDFLATYSREVKTDAAANHTSTQIMKVVSGLNKTLKGVEGMTTVGEEIANCIAPFIRKASTPTDDEDMVALLQITPDDIKVLQASDDKVMSEISDSAEQTRNKFNKKNNITNYEAIFYMMIVLVRYRPKKQTFDYYHAYVLCQDTSIWQWAMSSAEKQKRMAALQLECANLLGMELSRHSNQMVKVVPEIKPFEDLQKDLQKDLEVVPALTVAVPAQTLLDLAGRFRNEDFLATYSREVKTDAAVNHTSTQIMKVVSGLNKMFKDVGGMTTVGQAIANCIAPFIRKASTPTDDEDMVTHFQITPDDIKVLQASDGKVMSEMRDSVAQIRSKHCEIDGYETIFYMMIVLVRYRPKKQTFDLYYAYTLCRDTSIWQWVMTSAAKQKRMAALQVEGADFLGKELAHHSNKMVEAVPEIKAFEDLKKDLES